MLNNGRGEEVDLARPDSQKKVGKREIFGVKIAPPFCSNACVVARHFKSVHVGLI